MEIDWSETALKQMAALDKGIARRVKNGVERLAETGVGDVKKLTDVHPPEYRLRIGAHRVRFHSDGKRMSIVQVRPRGDAYRH